ncbi:hypothetical protein CRG98_044373 [Punica granatum]|uniref:Uncharacterized protein n=1 Tax=Punica granatum TaxID=22663 RepID=A0A2I0HU15_PUNGR|nr:hypothetical protein CRG98_044373 [Punica granatum]
MVQSAYSSSLSFIGVVARHRLHILISYLKDWAWAHVWAHISCWDWDGPTSSPVIDSMWSMSGPFKRMKGAHAPGPWMISTEGKCTLLLPGPALCSWKRNQAQWKKLGEASMVRLHVKYGEGDGEEEFLYDSQSSAQIEGVLREILQIANLQLKIDRLALELEPQLAPLYGDQKAVGLIRALSEAKAYASKDQVLHGKPLLYHALKDHFQVLEKELNSSYQLLGFSDSEQLQKLSANHSESTIRRVIFCLNIGSPMKLEMDHRSS